MQVSVSMHPALTHSPALLSTYLRRGEAGLDAMAEHRHDRAHERPGGKFGGVEAAYLPRTPVPPLGWPVRCERCRFYREGAPGVPARCHLVGREGDRWEMAELVVARAGGGRPERNVLGFGRDPAGELYVLTSETHAPSGETGAVHRLVAPEPRR